MRFLAAVLLWVLTTAALAVAVPAAWAQLTVVDEGGYADLAAQAARDPRLQGAMASELTTQLVGFAGDNGYRLNPALVRTVADSYVGNAGFPGQFAQANRIAHRWMFAGAVPSGNSTDRWLIDVAPMLKDPSFTATLGSLDLRVPETLTVPITVDAPALRPGKLRWLATWGPWASVGSAVVVAVLGLLTLAAARSKGKGLVALGVSGLLVGGAGWAAIEVAQRWIDAAVARTTGDIRTVAEVMVATAEDDLHRWLSATLVIGIGVVIIGVVIAAVGGVLRRPDPQRPGGGGSGSRYGA